MNSSISNRRRRRQRRTVKEEEVDTTTPTTALTVSQLRNYLQNKRQEVSKHTAVSTQVAIQQSTTEEQEAEYYLPSAIYSMLDMNVPYRPYVVYYVPSDWKLVDSVIKLNADIQDAYGTTNTQVVTLMPRSEESSIRRYPDREAGLISRTIYGDNVEDMLQQELDSNVFRIVLYESQVSMHADTISNMDYAIVPKTSIVTGGTPLDSSTFEDMEYGIYRLKEPKSIRKRWYSQLMNHLNVVIPSLIEPTREEYQSRDDYMNMKQVIYTILQDKEVRVSEKRKIVPAHIFPIAFVAKTLNMNYNYEVTELIGDKVTDAKVLWKAVTSTDIPDNEEMYTNVLQFYASEVKQSQIAEQLQLHRFVQGFGIRNSSVKLKEDVLEAFIGVLYEVVDMFFPDSCTADAFIQIVIDNLFKLNETALMSAPTRLSNWTSKLGVAGIIYREHNYNWYAALKNQKDVNKANSYLRKLGKNPLSTYKLRIGESTVFAIGSGKSRVDAALNAANKVLSELSLADIDKVNFEALVQRLDTHFKGVYERLASKHSNLSIKNISSNKTFVKQSHLIGVKAGSKSPTIITRTTGKGHNRTELTVLIDLLKKYEILESGTMI